LLVVRVDEEALAFLASGNQCFGLGAALPGGHQRAVADALEHFALSASELAASHIEEVPGVAAAADRAATGAGQPGK